MSAIAEMILKMRKPNCTRKSINGSRAGVGEGVTRAPLSPSGQAYTAGPSNTPYILLPVFLIVCYKPGLERIGGGRQLFCVCVEEK